MTAPRLVAAALALAAVGCGAQPTPPTSAALPAEPAAPPDSVADWSRAFSDEGAVGTFVLLDAGTGRVVRHRPARAARRFSPASTSKVFNALVFVDRGVVSDPDSVFAWDGRDRGRDAWNRDHSLRSAMEDSAVWLFQRGAAAVGRDGYAEVFARQPYGNSALSDSLEMSWLDGTWRISADEQVAFLDGLRRGALPFTEADQAAVRQTLPVLFEGRGGRVVGKTGWGLPEGEPAIGWVVGWVERAGGDLVFAMNAEEAPGARFEVGPGRLRIVEAVLREAGAWPE